MADAQPLEILTLGNDRAIVYTRYLRKIDLSYEAQSSADLGTWQPASESVIPVADVDTEQRRALLPGSPTSAYLRLSIGKQ